MRGGWSRRFALVASVLGLALTAISSTASAQLATTPCSSDRSDHSQCGRLDVPLDRSGAVPGTVSLRLRLQPPTSGAVTGTVLALAGGPGQAATPFLDTFAGALGAVLNTRQLVTFDQRGTGDSGKLLCSSRGAKTQADAVSSCATQLGAARSDYTTAASVEDVESVRAALGVDRMIIWGTSYGTKVALAYAAAYPQHVERLVLDSTVLPTGVDPFSRTTIATIPRVLRTLCAHTCRFTHDPARELATLVHQLTPRPLRGTALDSHGHRRHVRVTRSDLLNVLVAGDLNPALRAPFPAAVHAALHGDTTPLMRLFVGGGGGSGGQSAGDSDALYLATSCEDGSVPWPTGTPVAQRRAAVDIAAGAIPNAAFAPFDRDTARLFGNADLCRGWPEAPIVQPQPPLPATPTLLMSGDDDLRTPRSDAVALAGHLSGAQLLEVPDVGHSVLISDFSDCSQKAVLAFLAGGAAGHCLAHKRPLPALALPPLRLSTLRKLHGAGSAKAGRTVAAVVLTLGDLSDEIVASLLSGSRSPWFGALRSGSAKGDAKGLHLHGYSYVPGVTVTGVIFNGKHTSSTLTIGGSAAARGRLKISAKLVTGKLGGKRVRVTVKELGRKPLSGVAAAAAALTRAPGLGGEGSIPTLTLPSQLWRSASR